MSWTPCHSGTRTEGTLPVKSAPEEGTYRASPPQLVLSSTSDLRSRRLWGGPGVGVREVDLLPSRPV